MKKNGSIRILIPSLAVIFLLSGTLALHAGMPDNSVSRGNSGAITALKSSNEANISEHFKEDELFVKFKAGVSAKDKSLIHGKHGAKKIKEFDRLDIHLVRLNHGKSVEDAIDSYQKEPEVEYAEPNYKVTLQTTPSDPWFYELWGLNNTGQTGGTPGADISATEAWDITTGDNNVVVAVIDTGIDYTHEDLLVNCWLNTGEIAGNGIDDDGNGYVDDMHGINVITGTGDPLDDRLRSGMRFRTFPVGSSSAIGPGVSKSSDRRRRADAEGIPSGRARCDRPLHSWRGCEPAGSGLVQAGVVVGGALDGKATQLPRPPNQTREQSHRRPRYGCPERRHS